MARPYLRRIGGTCKHGHRLTPDNVDHIGRGKIRCRTCARESQRRTKGHQPRHYNRLGGTCSKGHPLTIATVYRRSDGYYQCAVCHTERTAKPAAPKPEPPTEKTCPRCGEMKPIAAYRTPGTKKCRQCVWANANGKARQEARLATVSRRAETRSIVAFCRTGMARLIADRGWTMARVAEAIGVSVKVFGRWMRDQAMPQPTRVAGLAEAMTELLAREGLL